MQYYKTIVRLFTWALDPFTHIFTLKDFEKWDWYPGQHSYVLQPRAEESSLSCQDRAKKPNSFCSNSDSSLTGCIQTEWHIELWSQPQRIPSAPPTLDSCRLSWSQPSPSRQAAGKATTLERQASRYRAGPCQTSNSAPRNGQTRHGRDSETTIK